MTEVNIYFQVLILLGMYKFAMAFHCLSLAMIMMSLGILTGHDLQNAMLYTDQQTQWEI